MLMIAISLGSIYIFKDELFPPPRLGASLDLGGIGIGNDVDYSEYEALYDELYAINSDYMGTIVFDSGLVDVPVVYADDFQISSFVINDAGFGNIVRDRDLQI